MMGKLQRMQRKKICVSFILAVLITFLLGGCSVLDGKTKKVQKNMTEYLKNTYEKEFVVEKPVLTGNAAFGYKRYYAKAYPKDQPEIIFGVAWDIGKPGFYYDDYLTHKWSFQGKAEVRQLLKKIYGEEILLWYSFGIDVKHIRNKETFKTLKQLNHSDISAMDDKNKNCKLEYYIFVDKLDKKAEASKVYQIYKEHMVKNKFDDFYVSVKYLSKDSKDELWDIIKNREKNFERYLREFDEKKLKRENQLINSLMITNASMTQRSEDIVKKFKY